MRMLWGGVTAAALLIAPLGVPAPPAEAAPVTAAPLYHSGRAVPGQYIVRLDRAANVPGTVASLGIKTMFTYDTVLQGFSAALTSAQLDAVRATPGVTAVEENSVIAVSDGTRSERQSRAAAASWGLDRIDQRNLPLDGEFNAVGTGTNTTGYILDSGIDFGHSEFGGRAVAGFDAVGDGRNGQDCNGHGTHVAGTVGGETFGIARSAKLVSVRVVDCSGEGSIAGTIAGLDWVARNAVQPAVLNASLGDSYSSALNLAADALAESGVLPVVSAGNDAKDACTASPASAHEVLAVGASDRTDRQTGFSNYGPCVSLFAPGQDIASAKLGGGSVSKSGTSMASPHVAGVALLYKAAHPQADAATVAGWLDGESTKDILSVTSGTPNRLLYTDGL
ncbi:S8 family serine peptidase [Streptomyces sp. NPDC048445]|uniref:S8 family peptidase n=1 Tax=Streptomyces sp. NPDC048445 TaxID=3365553 RepID=UPI0037165F34